MSSFFSLSTVFHTCWLTSNFFIKSFRFDAVHVGQNDLNAIRKVYREIYFDSTNLKEIYMTSNYELPRWDYGELLQRLLCSQKKLFLEILRIDDCQYRAIGTWIIWIFNFDSSHTLLRIWVHCNIRKYWVSGLYIEIQNVIFSNIYHAITIR